MIKITWDRGVNEYNEITGRVPAIDYHKQLGYYEFHVCLRPPHCDRGTYLVMVDSVGVDELDMQEGFPRYYFELRTVMSELEAWVNKRATCLAAAKLASEYAAKLARK